MASTREAVVLGKGTLAIQIADWLRHERGYELRCVVPVVPEPEWADSLIAWAESTETPYVASGDFADVGGTADLAISVGYDRIITPEFIGRCGRILNIHNAPLPRYRGMSPINWALKNGERAHGVTIHVIEPEIDAGPIVAQLLFSIYPETDEVIDVYRRCLAYGWALFEQTMPILDQIEPVDQDHTTATYYSRSDNELLGDRRSFTRAASVSS